MKKITHLALLFMLLAYISNAQTQTTLLEKVPIASPTAASLGKFADVPVNYHTGIPGISIPIYTVKEGPLQLPISIDYHASGLKVMEQSSWIGAGWALNAGGVITRTVKGLPDEKLGADGFGYINDNGYYNYLFGPGSSSQHPLLDYFNFANGKKDGEPDLFFFNFNGYSGKFYFRPDNTTVLIPQQDIRIEPLLCTTRRVDCNPTNESLYGWIITTPDGIKYYFGIEAGNSVDPPAIERTLPYSVTGGLTYQDVKTISSWHLYRIESADGLFRINLKYAKEDYSFYTMALSPIINGGSSGMNLSKNFLFGVRLSSIEFSNGTVSFIPETTARQDLGSSKTTTPIIYDHDNVNDPNSARALKEIRISGGTLCKSFDFMHSYFADTEPLHGDYGSGIPDVGTVYNLHSDKKRLKLDAVRGRSCDNSIMNPSHSFEYYDPANVPRGLSLAQDHWGFYNAAVENTSMIPPVSTDGGWLFTDGANRESNWPAMRAGALKRVTYPTGGSTELTYESHNVFVNQPKFFPPVFRYSVSARGNTSFSRSDTYTLTVASTTVFKIQMRNFQGGSGVVYVGSQTFTPSSENWGERLVTLTPGSYKFYCTSTGKASQQGLEAKLYELQRYNYQWLNIAVGGLRIARISHHTESNNNAVVQKFEYVNANGESQGVLFSRPTYIGLLRNNQLTLSGIAFSGGNNGEIYKAQLSNGCIEWDTNSMMYYVSPSSIFPMRTTQGNHFGYNQVKVIQADGGYTIYKYKISQNQPGGVCVNMIDRSKCDLSSPNFPAAPEPHDFSRGELRNVQIYNSANLLLKENQVINEYTDEPIGINGLLVKGIGEGKPFVATEYTIKTAKKTKSSELELIYNPVNRSQAPLAKLTETYYTSAQHALASRKVVTDILSGNNMSNILRGRILREEKNSYVADLIPATCDNTSATTCDQRLTQMMDQCLTAYNSAVTGSCNALCRFNAWLRYTYCQNVQRQIYTSCRKTYNADLRDCRANMYTTAGEELKAVLDLIGRNQIGSVIETSLWRTGKFIGSTLTRLMDFGNRQIYPARTDVINCSSPQPASIFRPVSSNKSDIVRDSNYKIEETYKYRNGNIVEIAGRNGEVVSYTWGYKNTLPVARAINSQITVYTYDPLVGLTSQKDPNGLMNTYFYDRIGRLDHIKDNDGNISQKQKYNYRVPGASSGLGGIGLARLDNEHNFVRTSTILKARVTNAALIQDLSINEKSEITNYYDGLARLEQSVSLKFSPAGNDVVQPFVYDAVGRDAVKYLPFVAGNNGQFKEKPIDVNGNYINSATNFYSNLSDQIADDPKPYSRTLFEQSPLNRAVEQGAAGLAWQPGSGHTIRKTYELNGSKEVLAFNVDVSTLSVALSSVESERYFPASQLYANRTIDEHQNDVLEYINKEGKVVCKKVKAGATTYAETYYLYDDFGNLIMVIPPEGVASLVSNVSKKTIDNWTFQYRYDERKRMTHKKHPGADWVYMVYDDRDRLVMTQDGELRKLSQWVFTKYDTMNRPVTTGIYTHNAMVDQAAMSKLYATSATKLQGKFESLTFTYYDNYNFIWGDEFRYRPKQVEHQRADAFRSVAGKPTGASVRTSRNDNRWIRSINYYDDRYRVIQTISDTHKGGIDVLTNVYDFVGKITDTKSEWIDHHSVTRHFDYDHSGRLIRTYHRVGNGPTILLSQQEYNELGQLIDKKLHSTNSTNFRQSIDYRYNIRGWLTSINGAEMISNSKNNDKPHEGKDLFGMDLLYNDPVVPGLGNQQFYNGNISAMLWSLNSGMTAGSRGGYKYAYDAMNRLNSAEHMIWNNDWKASGSFYEGGLTYDLNGNIRTLKRTTSNGDTMDQLGYDYGSGEGRSNMLQKVADLGTQNGFSSRVSSGNNYSYDTNGNMIADNNKEISIAYNYLNLPVKVTKATNEYLIFVYDANGKKLSQELYSAAGALKTRSDYMGDWFYENDTLRFVSHEEGRVVFSPSGSEYQYHLKDHLGNVRMTFTTKDEYDSTRATMEAQHLDRDRLNYLRYDLARRIQSSLFDHTNNGKPDKTGYAVRLNGSANERIGLARSISVMPGDSIRAEVWAKYVLADKTKWSAALITLMGYALQPQTAPGGLIVDGASYNSSGLTSLGITPIKHDTDKESSIPKAYLNYIFINRNFDLSSVKTIATRIYGDGESGSDIPHARLTVEDIITEPGYVYVYLSNDGEQFREVYFDDFKLEHIKSPVVQSQDYYPFGMRFNAYARESSLLNKSKLFQGQEHIDDLDLSWDSFKWRNHQPEIGRFFGVDKLSEKFYYNSPYAFAENKLGRGVELEGLELVPFELVKTWASLKVERVFDNNGIKKTEREVARENPGSALEIYVSKNKETAENFAVESGLPGIHNGPADALRHSLFNALNTQTAGEKAAKQFGDAHEEDRPNQPANEKIMDLGNNEMGRKVALTNPTASPKELAKMLTDSIMGGKLKILDSAGNVVPSNTTKEQTDAAKVRFDALDNYGNN